MFDSLSDEQYKKRIRIEIKLTKSIFKILGKSFLVIFVN
jgi:hypothetical protein